MNRPLLTGTVALLVGTATIAQAPIEVRVLDAATGAVVPDVTVYATGSGNPMYQVPRDPFEPLLDRIVRAGKPFRSDAKGTVVLPADLLPVELAVRHGGRFASVQVAWPPPPRLVLALAPDTEVALRITDAAGTPANVAVHVSRVLPGQASAGQVSLRPDVNGIATLRLGALHTERTPWILDGRVDEAIVALQLAVVARAAPRAEFALAEAPATLHLVAPECGTVEVSVLDDAGQPMREGWVNLAPVGFTATSRADHAEIRDGKARFEAVAVGTRLIANTSLCLRRGVQTEFDGPERAGASVSITLRGTLPRGDGRPVVTLRGRVVDDRKQPIANTGVCIGVLRNANLLDGVQPRCTTATDGTFTCELLGPLTQGDELVVATAAATAPKCDHVAFVRVDRTANALDLGDLRPQPAPLLCDVRVVDAAGRPVVHVLHVSAADQLPLLPLPGSNLQSDRHGHVHAFAAIAREQLLSVQTWTPGTTTPPHRFPSGRAHTVTVPTTHPVPGRVQLAAARHAPSLTARLVLAETYGQPSCGFDRVMPWSVPIAPDGTFVAGPVTAGKYHLQVLLGDAFEVALVENVEVGGDGVVDADRLRRIDLAEAVREVTVQVDRDGLADDVVGDVQMAPLGEFTPGKVVRTVVQSWFRQRPLTLLVPTRGEWTLRTEVAGQLGPTVRVEGTKVRLSTR